MREAWAKSASAPPSCFAGSISAASPTSTPDDGSGQVAARQAAGSAESPAGHQSSSTPSADGTIKWLFDVGGGNAVEAVFIPRRPRHAVRRRRRPACAVGCRFCSTGHQGFSRNLTSGEIVGQLWFAEHRCARAPPIRPSARIDNVVMMGMGEPLQNYAALVPALRHARRPRLRPVAPPRDGVHLGRGADDRPPGATTARWRWRCRCTRPDDALRDELVPLNRKYPLAELLAACRYLDKAPRDFITFEYCMLDGVNDGAEHARGDGSGGWSGRVPPASST